MTRFELPPQGHLLHGVRPGGEEFNEQKLVRLDYDDYVRAAGGVRPAWIYFSHEWWPLPNGLSGANPLLFPICEVRTARSWGATPYIRLMLRSSHENGEEKKFTLPRIIGGDFDCDLQRWGRDAGAFLREGNPLICEWGTEANGNDFHWNPCQLVANKHAQNVPAAIKMFVQAYRHIIDQIRAGDRICQQIRWVLHFDAIDHDSTKPSDQVGAFELGPDYIDWYGVSIYGRQERKDDLTPFEDKFQATYDKLQLAVPHRPVLLCEFGTMLRPPTPGTVDWVDNALKSLLEMTGAACCWPNLRACSWWNEAWESDKDKEPKYLIDMRLQSGDNCVKTAYQQFLRNGRVLSAPPLAQ